MLICLYSLDVTIQLVYVMNIQTSIILIWLCILNILTYNNLIIMQSFHSY